MATTLSFIRGTPLTNRKDNAEEEHRVALLEPNRGHEVDALEQPEGTMAKKPKMLDELFHDTLKDIYFAEKKILAALPKMAKAAQNADLKAAFEKHAGETE